MCYHFCSCVLPAHFIIFASNLLLFHFILLFCLFPSLSEATLTRQACLDLFDFFLVLSSSLSSVAALSFNSLSFKINCILKSPLSFAHLCTPTSKPFSLYPFTFSLLCLLGKCFLRVFIALLSASDIVEEKYSHQVQTSSHY